MIDKNIASFTLYHYFYTTKVRKVHAIYSDWINN